MNKVFIYFEGILMGLEERMKAVFERRGITVVDSMDQADTVVIDTEELVGEISRFNKDVFQLLPENLPEGTDLEALIEFDGMMDGPGFKK